MPSRRSTAGQGHREKANAYASKQALAESRVSDRLETAAAGSRGLICIVNDGSDVRTSTKLALDRSVTSAFDPLFRGLINQLSAWR